MTAQKKKKSVAEKCKSLMVARKSGTFSTVSSEQKLFGGLMPYILNDERFPVIALRNNETHYKHLEFSSNAAIGKSKKKKKIEKKKKLKKKKLKN